MADTDNRCGTRLREKASWLCTSMWDNWPLLSCRALLAGLALVLIAGQVDAETVNPTAVYVVDGDTIRMDGDSWRLVGLDTPETYEPRCDFELALGQAATARLRGLMASGRLIEVTRLPGRDRFDRGLARLYVGGENIADILIREGLARAYDGGRRESWCG
ncbi:thermonuclease family protein [Phaeobacter inhibens]|uniref:thermonuclease family protein n=1 Tax=Phaeobacter inhibens TaxID=221822 RepID=UPI000CA1E2FD|nr:thermonuclease family protein [Phaeobacter inhibens]AUR22537.1 Endonuclease YncB precursor [Phaeobacter inhibens]